MAGMMMGEKEMNQSERRMYLIKELLAEQPGYGDIEIPANASEQRRLLRSLMNVRMAAPVDNEFLQVQDAYLQEINEEKGYVTLADMEELQEDLYLWRGDITRLVVGAIVNAANSGMTGCYQPCHNCIDNCIHTYAGVQLREFCNEMMQEQGYAEPTGRQRSRWRLSKTINYRPDRISRWSSMSLRKRTKGSIADYWVEMSEKGMKIMSRKSMEQSR